MTSGSWFYSLPGIHAHVEPKPATIIRSTMRVEQWDGKQWVEHLLTWDGEKYTEVA